MTPAAIKRNNHPLARLKNLLPFLTPFAFCSPQDHAAHRLLRGKQAVTPEMALRLGKRCGNGPEFWLRLQRRRDLWPLERTLAADLARIPTHRAA
jgi:hypothetical protein